MQRRRQFRIASTASIVLAIATVALATAAQAVGGAPAVGGPWAATAADTTVPIRNAVYIIEADSRSPQGYLRVGIDRSAVGAPAVLQRPVTDFALRSLRHRQYWRAVYRSDYGYQFRNLYSDMCLTVARPEHSPVYLQYCGASVLGQYWFPFSPGIIRSNNYGKSPDGRGMCLDITEFRNAPGTRLQVGKCHRKWNQIWKFKRVSETYAN